MRHPRHNRLLNAIVALVSLLFMQLAVAAYACPDLIPAPNAPMLDSVGQPMVDCPEMDRQSSCMLPARRRR
jgi:hypothetical protein